MHRVYWLTRRRADLPAGSLWLSPAERAQEATLRIPKRREDWRLGRFTAKQALLRVLCGPVPARTGFLQELVVPAEAASHEWLPRAQVRPAANGAPRAFWDDAPAPWTLSISHSHDRALVALAPLGTALGCDLELIEHRSCGFHEDSFTRDERDAIAAWPEPEVAATLFWSAKESMLKALGEGLRLPLQDFAVSAEPAGEEWRPFCVRERPRRRTWRGYWRRADEWIFTLLACRPSPLS